MPMLERHDDVFVLDLGDTENRFHPDWLTSSRHRWTSSSRRTGRAPW